MVKAAACGAAIRGSNPRSPSQKLAKLFNFNFELLKHKISSMLTKTKPDHKFIQKDSTTVVIG